MNAVKDIENVVIVGSGPAGYTAALYTSRADLEPLVVEGFQWGGLLQQTTDVENYHGYPDGVMGPEMMQQFVGDQEIHAKTVILAMGAEPKKLGVPGEDELAAKGVSYCATCDAAFFRDKPTIVVGGGDTAMEDATFLSKFASKVGIVHRRPEFRASAIMLDRAKATDNIELITPYVVQRFEGDGDGSLSKAVLRSREDGSTKELDIQGAFVAIGHRPNSDLVKGQVLLDENGYVMTGGAAFKTEMPAEEKSTRTNLAGVFAAGDLVDHTYRQAVTAAGTGCMAALDAEWYLRDNPAVPTPEALEGTGDLAEQQWAPAMPQPTRSV